MVKHKIMCSCGKLAIKCDEANDALMMIVVNGKKEVFDEIMEDKTNFWINAITKELNYRQRIIGIIKVEDGEIISHLSTFQKKSDIIAVKKQTAVMDNN